MLIICQNLVSHAVVFLVARSDICSSTHWACIDWFRYLGDSFVQNYAWVLCLVISIWIMSYHSSFKCSVSSRSRGPNLKQSGNGISVINQEPNFRLNLWAIGWELFKTVQKPLHKWPRLPLTIGNFQNFWMNMEKSFPEQMWFFQILVLVVFWVVARISDFWDVSYPSIHV